METQWQIFIEKNKDKLPITLVRINQVSPGDAKRINQDERFKQLKESIKKEGLREPIIVAISKKEGQRITGFRILHGNHR